MKSKGMFSKTYYYWRYWQNEWWHKGCDWRSEMPTRLLDIAYLKSAAGHNQDEIICIFAVLDE